MKHKGLQSIAVTSSIILAALFVFILIQTTAVSNQGKMLSALFLDILFTIILAYFWALFIDNRRLAKKRNEKPAEKWPSLILITLICLTQKASVYMGLNANDTMLFLTVSIYFILLIFTAILWIFLWIQTDFSRIIVASWTMRLLNKLSGKPGFVKIKKFKGKVLTGDIFAIRFVGDSYYYYGRVLATKLLAKERDVMIDGSHVVFFFSSKTKELTLDNLELNYPDSATGPFLVADLNWRKGYFCTVGNVPLSVEEQSLEYGFMLLNDEAEPVVEEYYDKELMNSTTKPYFLGPAYQILLDWLCDLLKRVLSNSGEKPLNEYLRDDLFSTKYNA